MRPSFDDEARTGARSASDEVGPTLIIWCDWKGELYAFCGWDCQRHYDAWVGDPGYPFEKATWTGASFGCIWCGGDLTRGARWLSREPPAGSEVVRPR